jgi:hypothetical protein
MIVFWVAALALVAREPSSKTPDRPFTVFVLSAPADESQAIEDLERGAEELRKRVAKKKDWFRLAERKEDAEIVVEVEQHRVREHLTFWASTRAMGGETQGVSNSTISRYHSLRAMVVLLGTPVQLTGTDPKRTGSIKGAASALMKELLKVCQERYGELRSMRTPPPV